MRGRGFLETDRADTPLVAVVNTHLPSIIGPSRTRLESGSIFVTQAGHWFRWSVSRETGKYVWIAEPPLDFIYLPYTQARNSALTVLAESSGSGRGNARAGLA